MKWFRGRATATDNPAHVHVDPVAARETARAHRIDTLVTVARLRVFEAMESFDPDNPEAAAWLRHRGLPDNYRDGLVWTLLEHYAQRIRIEETA